MIEQYFERHAAPIDQLTWRVLAKFPGIPFEDARAKARELWSSPSFRICSLWFLRPNTPLIHMNGFVCELLAQSILPRLGVRTAPARICNAEEARGLSADFVVKTVTESGLGWNPGRTPVGWCLVSTLVPSAATISYVVRKILKAHAPKSLPDDKLYAEFKPTPVQLKAIEAAIDVDGERHLRICVARAFIGCSGPRFENTLVAVEGELAELVSIDHSHACFEDGNDLRRLFDFVGRDSQVFRLLGEVAALGESDIRTAIASVPQHPACGSTAGLEEYFCKRLRLWQNLCFRLTALPLILRIAK
jgi:hypothetical protein